MVIPVHDINPVRRTPWVTYVILAVNVVVLLLTPVAATSFTGAPATTAQACREAAFLDEHAAIPQEMITDKPLRLVATGQLGSAPGTCVVAPPAYRKNPVLSVLEAMFIHSGWLHLLGNMLFLVIFGNNVEDRFRKLPFLLFYLFCGYVAAYGFAWAFQTSAQPLVGASGAIAGVLGAYLVLWPRARCGRSCRSCSSSRCASRRGWCSAAGSSCSGRTRPGGAPPVTRAWPTWRTCSASSPGP